VKLEREPAANMGKFRDPNTVGSSSRLSKWKRLLASQGSISVISLSHQSLLLQNHVDIHAFYKS